jgi:hypothetical protein
MVRVRARGEFDDQERPRKRCRTALDEPEGMFRGGSQLMLGQHSTKWPGGQRPGQ